MPIIEVSFKDFKKLVGKKLPKKNEKLWDLFLYIKSEIEGLNKDDLKIEVADSNRPDMWCVEGLARSLRGALKIETGVPIYKAKKSKYEVKVKKGVKKIRPFIASAIVKDLKFDNNTIKQLIQLQDKLDRTYGRNRKKSAIGIYDYDKIKFPITYKTVKPNSIKFVPLGFGVEMTPKQILLEHPKGIEFAGILEGKDKYPILIDAENKVLSMPPIINSNDVGKVTEKTKNVFIEVTGINIDTVTNALNIVTATLSDRGGKVKSVKINYGKKKLFTPNFSSKTMSIDVASIKKRLGLELKKKEIISLLSRARFNVKKFTNKKITIEMPFYRTDIMHEFDVIEDIGIMYGYKNIASEDVNISTVGGLLDSTAQINRLRDIVIGMGFQEVLNYTRCDKEILFNKDNVEIANPISTKMNSLRNELLPLNLQFLSKNTHNEYPQKIFEVGNVFIKKNKNVTEEDHLCVVDCSSTADFTNIKQNVEWIMSNLRVKFEVKEYEHVAFVPGRCASIKVKGKTIGYFGEIHPQILNKYGIETPISVLEIKI